MRFKILTANYDLDKERFFIITFNTENTFNQNYGSKILETINQHHNLYCISLLTDDYVCKVIFLNL